MIHLLPGDSVLALTDFLDQCLAILQRLRPTGIGLFQGDGLQQNLKSLKLHLQTFDSPLQVLSTGTKVGWLD